MSDKGARGLPYWVDSEEKYKAYIISELEKVTALKDEIFVNLSALIGKVDELIMDLRTYLINNNVQGVIMEQDTQNHLNMSVHKPDLGCHCDPGVKGTPGVVGGNVECACGIIDNYAKANFCYNCGAQLPSSIGRAKKGEKYYYLRYMPGVVGAEAFIIQSSIESYTGLDKDLYDIGNYFLTEKAAGIAGKSLYKAIEAHLLIMRKNERDNYGTK